MKPEYSRQILKKCQISNFMEIRPVGAELFHEDRRKNGRTDIHDEVNITFGNFANAPKNQWSIRGQEIITKNVLNKFDLIVGLLETLCEIPAWLLTFQKRLTFLELFTKFTYYSFLLVSTLRVTL